MSFVLTASAFVGFDSLATTLFIVFIFVVYGACLCQSMACGSICYVGRMWACVPTILQR